MKHKKKFSAIFILAISIFQYYKLSETTLSIDVLSNIITFLSILFGFYVTSLAIFVSSTYVSSLSSLTDPQQKNRTLLHTLTENYKYGLVLSLLTISYLLVINFYYENYSDSVLAVVSMSEYLTLPLIGIISLNLLFSYLMLNDLIRIIIQEGKSKL